MYNNNERILELDMINKHICMNTVLMLIDVMVKKFPI